VDHLSPRRVGVRGEHLSRGWAWLAWLCLAAFIAIVSAGHWAPYQPGIWAPWLVTPKDAARNVLVYVPFGALGMVALGRGDLRGVARVAGIAALFSLVNEALQLYTTDRVASITDVLWAFGGAGIGAAGVWLTRR
jgi:VanZ family protein